MTHVESNAMSLFRFLGPDISHGRLKITIVTARTLGISRRALLYKIKRFREQGYNVGPNQM